MKEQSRVLAYNKASELTNEELEKILGGNSKLTVQLTGHVTGGYPNTPDGVTDQQWDF